jgi:hypothetical protein
MCIPAKIYNKMTLNRIQIVRMNQNGYRQRRTRVVQILTLQRIIEAGKAKHFPETITLILRRHPNRVLKACGIPKPAELLIVIFVISSINVKKYKGKSCNT